MAAPLPPQQQMRRQIDEGIRAEQVQLIYEQAPPAAVISAFVASMLVFLLWARRQGVA